MNDEKVAINADAVDDANAPARSRRDLLRGAAAAAAGGAALLLAKAEPAQAATGGPLLMGSDNTCDQDTILSASDSLIATFFAVSQQGTGVRGQHNAGGSTGVGVFGYHAGSGAGVYGESDGVGVLGRSRSNSPTAGVEGRIDNPLLAAGYGVHGVHKGGGAGVFGESENGRGVTGETKSAGTDSAGVVGLNRNGSGLTSAGVWGENNGTGEFASGVRGLHRGAGIGVLAQVVGSGIAVFASTPGRELHLDNSGRIFQKPRPTAGVPTETEITYEVGDTLRDSRGDIYLCVVAGKPGDWRKVVAGAPAYENRSGSINFLTTPIRILDTRAGEPAPLPAVKQKMTVNQELVVQLTGTAVGGVSVPLGAVGMIGNLTVTVTDGPGWLKAYPSGVTEPLVSSINYGTNDTVANGLMMSLNGAGQLTLKCGVSGTHVVLDIAGFVY